MADWEVLYYPADDKGIIRASKSGAHVEQVIQFQHGPIGENGINGIQNEEALDLIAMRLRSLNAKFPCRENSIALTHIETARLWLQERTSARRLQGVEGKYAPHVS